MSNRRLISLFSLTIFTVFVFIVFWEFVMEPIVDPLAGSAEEPESFHFKWRLVGTSFFVAMMALIVPFFLLYRNIAKGRRNEDELEEKTNLLLQAERLGKIGHWVVYAKTGELYWSDEVFRIHGQKIGSEIDVEAAINAYHPDDRELVAEYLRKALEDKESYQFELRLVKKDGVLRKVRSTGIVKLDASGDVHSVFGVFQDITDRNQTEKALMVSEGRFKDIARASSDTFWEMDKHFRFTYFSDAGQKDRSRERNHVLGKTRWELSGGDPETDEKWKNHRADLLAHRQFRGFEYDRNGNDGSFANYRVSGTPIFDDDGTFSGYRGSASDITERVAAGEALLVVQKRFRTVVDNLPMGISLRDSEDRFLLINRQLADWYGLSEEGLIGKRMEDVSEEPEAIHVARQVQTRAMLEKQTALTCEVKITRADGNEHTVEVTKFPIRGTDGKAAIVGTISVDVTERAETDEALHKALDTAEKANQVKSEFLATMSHELRTPLNAILGFTQLLNTDPDHPLPPQQLDATEQVLKAGKHLLSLIEQVLDLSAIESGKVSLDVEVQDPGPVIKNCAAIALNLAEQNGLVFYDRTARWAFPELEIDETRFRQVLLNLLSNAVKYNRDGGTVTLDSEEVDGGKLRISITDSGHGIALEKHDLIFTPFSRLGLENSNISGTGIGLTIAKDLVEAMGGSIGFESTLNEGSMFWLEFPIVGGKLSAKDSDKNPAAPAAPAAQKSTPVDTDKTLPGSRTVLYVEDNPESLKLLESIIERIPGATMIAAHTGELGIELAEIHRPDVILMDINLPGISGLEALKRLKISEATKNIPVIALTGLASKKDKAEGLDAGFSDYLTKPVSVKELTSIITQGYISA